MVYNMRIMKRRISMQILRLLIFFFLILALTVPAFAEDANYYCCQPDGCGPHQPFNPCTRPCTIERDIECNGVTYTLVCDGVGYIWAIYPTTDGHIGCIPEGDPIVLCASDKDSCTGGPPPGTICPAWMSVSYYDAGTC